jgi:hypothetical protein
MNPRWEFLEKKNQILNLGAWETKKNDLPCLFFTNFVCVCTSILFGGGGGGVEEKRTSR